MVHIGTRRPERPTQVIDWIRANCIALRLTAATAPTQGRIQVGETAPQRFAAIIRAATILGAAKNGARCAREISCTSLRGDDSRSASRAARPADSPPGSRAEINRLYRSGASYIRPPFHLRATD